MSETDNRPTLTDTFDEENLTFPARFMTYALFGDGREERFWTDDRSAALARYEAHVADPEAQWMIVFDYQACLDIAMFDRPALDEHGRPIRKTNAELKRECDEALDRMMDQYLAGLLD